MWRVVVKDATRVIFQAPSKLSSTNKVPALMNVYSRYLSDVESSGQPTKLSFAEFDNLLPKIVESSSLRIPRNAPSFANYIEFSSTLQNLAKIGVKFYEIEKRFPDAMGYLPMLDLKDVKPKVEFLVSMGIEHQNLGDLLTRNPRILSPEIDIQQFEEIIEYLKEKKFDKAEVQVLVRRLPTILTIPLARLDGILGFYQHMPTNRSEKELRFTQRQVINNILRCPSLIQANLTFVYERIRTLEVSFGFTIKEIRKMILGYPGILMEEEKQLELLFKFYTRVLKLSNNEISGFPKAFSTRIQKILERHEYLKKHGRAEYRRDQPGYISLLNIYSLSDKEFCESAGLGDVSHFYKFIKTL